MDTSSTPGSVGGACDFRHIVGSGGRVARSLHVTAGESLLLGPGGQAGGRVTVDPGGALDVEASMRRTPPAGPRRCSRAPGRSGVRRVRPPIVLGRATAPRAARATAAADSASSCPVSVVGRGCVCRLRRWFGLRARSPACRPPVTDVTARGTGTRAARRRDQADRGIHVPRHLEPVGRESGPSVVQGPRTTVTLSPRGHSLTKSSRPGTRSVAHTLKSVRSISRTTVASTSRSSSGRRIRTTSPITSRCATKSIAIARL